MSSPDVVLIQDLAAVVERDVDVVRVGYTQLNVSFSGTGTPSGTVVSETGYGQSSAAGAASAYSRGDHTHGTPALPTPAGIGAATTGHAHSGVYDPSGTAAAAVTGHEAAPDPHPAYLTQGEGDARYSPLGASGAVFPLAGYGLTGCSGDPLGFMANSSMANNQVFLARVWIPAGTPISRLWAAVRLAGGHDGVTGPNQLGLYTDAGVLVDTIANDPTLWTVAGWRGGLLAGGTVAAQGAGRFVYVGLLARGMTGGSWPYPTGADDNQVPWFAVPASGTANRRGLYLTGQTSMPASFNPVAGGTATTFMPLVGVS